MLKHAAFLAVLFAVFYIEARGVVMYGPYSYDEADYMFAVSKGVLANATDSPTLPLLDLIRIGATRGRQPGHRAELSDMIRSEDDMVFYRHWHGPLYVDWLRIMAPFGLTEQDVRGCTYVFPIVTALLLYIGLLWLLGGAAGWAAAMIGSALFLWSFPVVSSNELAPHELYALFATAALVLLAKLFLAGDGDLRRYWYSAIVMTALAFCTLEISFVLIATVLICGHAVRNRLRPDIGLGVKSIAAFVLPIVVVWPAAILKLSFVKAYLFMGYLAIFRKGAWGDVGFMQTWGLRLITTPIPWLLFTAAVLLIVFRRKQLWSPALLPFTIYVVSMFLALVRVNTTFPRYVLPLLPGVVLLAAFTFGRLLGEQRPAFRNAAVAMICAVMFLTTYPQIRALPRTPDPKAFAMLDLVQGNHFADKPLLVPQSEVPTIHYYFPKSHPRGYSDQSAIPDELRRGDAYAVLYDGDPPRYSIVTH